MAGMFVLVGDEDHARDEWNRNGRGYWQRAFPLVLEKYGYLAAEMVTRTDLNEDTWKSYDCGVIASLPERDWDGHLVDLVTSGTTPVLVEAPLPELIRSRLGIRVSDRETGGAGVLRLLDRDLRGAAADFGYPGGGHIASGNARPVERRHEMDWSAIPGIPLTESQARKWKTPSWEIERWALEGASNHQVIADFSASADGANATPAVVLAGHIVAVAASLTAYLGQGHTSHPWESGEYFSSVRRTGLETAVLALIDMLHAIAGAPRARVMPWPRGASWVRSVRHDYDRQLSLAQTARVLALHDREGSSATWYWRARHVGATPRLRLRRRHEDPIRLVANHRRSEVAFHTEALWVAADDERARIERAIDAPVVGTCAHGDPTCFRFQGAPNILWAESRGMQYTELIEHAHFHPHRFAAVDEAGNIQALSVLCLPHHESFDRTTARGETNAAKLLESIPRWEAMGGAIQVMNHPDIHTEELFEVLRAMSSAGRLDLTAKQIAKWWRSTHDRQQLSLRTSDPGVFEMESVDGVSGVVLEVRQPDGRRRLRVVDLAPGARASVSVQAAHIEV